MILSRVVLPSLLACLGPVAQAQIAPDIAHRIDAVFGHYTSASPGCALHIARDDRSVYTHGYGMASLDFGVPVSARTVFNIASASKQFTAASIALLALDGKLSLDVDWTVIASDSTVTIRDQRGGETIVHPVFRDAFDGLGTARFERDDTGRVTALTLTTRGVHALRFDRDVG